MSTILDQILETKRAEVAAGKAKFLASARHDWGDDFSSAEADRLYGAEAALGSEPRGFHLALERKIAAGGCGLIAEIKKASPSKGLIRADFHPPSHARAYEAGGAACLSVLTDEKYFQGSPKYLVEARNACTLPVLRKDFMIDPWQVDESRAMGADAILIIVAALSDGQMAEIEAAAIGHDIDVLVEVHDEKELERAYRLKSRLIGVNNRNLKDFAVDFDRTLDVLKDAPPGCTFVAESGITGHRDVRHLADNGIKCFLVGEALMRQPDVEAATRELLGG
ncbi:MAG: indole-3-glycerol phosphate synthase TrpC [Sphingomonadales bacterium]|nr:MAG: indole-3-glycerol phosphate synthase TrpC [Sphingomonadales bacterium]